MFQLNYLNTCTADAFAAALGEIFEHSPWVAQGATAKRPFPTVAALHDAMMAVVRAAPADRQLAFLQAHPELGSKVGRAPVLTEASRDEQGGLGLDRLSDQEFERFNRLNALYRERFGFPFIIAVRGQRDRAAILTALETRTNNSEKEEIDTAIAEVAKIAWFRLSDLIEP